MVIKEYLSGIQWVDEPLVAKATPSQWESFTPELVSKESFFTDNFTGSPTPVTMDTNECKEDDVPHDTTLVAMDRLSRSSSIKDNTPSSRSSYVKDDTPSVTIDNTTPVSDQSQVSLYHIIIVATPLLVVCRTVPAIFCAIIT